MLLEGTHIGNQRGQARLPDRELIAVECFDFE